MTARADKEVAIIGYSGHGLVVVDIFRSAGRLVAAYCDNEKKKWDPYGLNYLGTESEEAVRKKLAEFDYFIAIGHNGIRRKIYESMAADCGEPTNAVHRSAVLSPDVRYSTGLMVAANVSVNPFVTLGKGVICNTGSVIEHECHISDFVHIAPGAVLNGNVTVGENSFIGANSVTRQGVKIGRNVVVGAGAVIIEDIPDGVTVVGNPQRIIKS